MSGTTSFFPASFAKLRCLAEFPQHCKQMVMNNSKVMFIVESSNKNQPEKIQKTEYYTPEN